MITGSDSWTWAEQQWFWDRALKLTAAAQAPVTFETHRSRSLADPWSIQDWISRYPGLRLTADLSHWCVACERLMTPDLEPIKAIAERVDHIHARVGHAQGPQVSHPFAPEHAEALEAHRACWQLFLDRARARGMEHFTLTPEFGPDGYLPTLPFTNQPVADLLQINITMAAWLRADDTPLGVRLRRGGRYCHKMSQARTLETRTTALGMHLYCFKTLGSGVSTMVTLDRSTHQPNHRQQALVSSLRQRISEARSHNDSEIVHSLFREAVYLDIQLELLYQDPCMTA
ncbi:MAG: hypothetical protein QUV06_04485 [Cyanobium sp. CZS 48M]|nr:hypothetical protein [Cyanobium sp. CZS48M]